MTGYVQMHFVSRENEMREAIFGDNWNDMPPQCWNEYKEQIKENSITGVGHTIDEIVKTDFKVETDDGFIDDDIRVRFDSIIEFPYFLIHTLKVYVAIQNIQHDTPSVKILDDLLDDKKLLESFSRVISHVVNKTGKISENKEAFSREFIVCLLRTRFLFDKYIIKREYANESADGEWSLKELNVSVQQTKKKPYYTNTRFIKKESVTRKIIATKEQRKTLCSNQRCVFHIHRQRLCTGLLNF